MIIEGIVVHGNSLGGRMGFPTANIEADAALDARDGVYASRVEVDGRMYDAMSNLGYKPTSTAGAVCWRPISSASRATSTVVGCG